MNTINQAQYFILKQEITEVLKEGYSSTGEKFTPEEIDNLATSMIMDWVDHCKIVSDHSKQMLLLDEKLNETLQSIIYTVLINGYDAQGEELGMGEMGECEDAAEQIIKDFCQKANIQTDF
jgi:hypothetical protein